MDGYFSKLIEIDLINNPLKDFNQTVDALLTLPKLSNLKISIDRQEEALLVLQCLTNLTFLNGKPTKPSNNFEIDIEDADVDNISLDHELENFQQLFNTIQAKLEDNNNTFFSDFSQQFQSLLNNEIEMINEYLDSSVPNFIYGTKILNSKLKVFNFFNDVIIKIDNNNSLNSTLVKINESKNKAIYDLEEINRKMLIQVGNFQSKKGKKTSSKDLNNFNSNNDLVINEQNQNIQKLEEENKSLTINNIKNEENLTYFNNLVNDLKEEINTKNKEIEHYKEIESMALNKINQLEEENKLISEKLFQHTKIRSIFSFV